MLAFIKGELLCSLDSGSSFFCNSLNSFCSFSSSVLDSLNSVSSLLFAILAILAILGALFSSRLSLFWLVLARNSEKTEANDESHESNLFHFFLVLRLVIRFCRKSIIKIN